MPMKMVVIGLLIVLLLVSPAGASEPGQLVEEQVRGLDTSGLRDVLGEVNREVEGYLEPLTLERVLGWFKGESGPDLARTLQGLMTYLFREVMANGRLLAQLIVLAVVAAVLQSLQEAFEQNTVGRLAYLVVHMALVILALSSFGLMMETARAMVDSLVSFMVAILPLMVGLLAGSGAPVSAGLLHPLMVFVIHAVAMLVKNAVIPLLFMAAILDVVGSLFERFAVSNLSGLLKQVSVGALGILMSVFLGVLAVQGGIGAVADGVTLRTAKFVTGAFIPVVGKMFSDAVELVVGSSLLLRNAMGVLGLLAVVTIAAFPLLKMLSVVLVYRVAAAVIEPLGVGQVSVCLNRIGTVLVLVMVSAAAVALMFFLAMAILLGAGNVAAMLRM